MGTQRDLVRDDLAPAAIPPLENGDRLTRREFERRYAAMPQVKKAELIEGVVYMPSPAHFRAHGQPHAQVMAWLGVYCAATPGVHLGDNATVRLDRDNEVQPDALLRLDPAAGGHSTVGEDDYVEGPPELIVEIASSSVSYDLYDKLKVYRRSGVQEYLVWQVYDRRVDWLCLVEEEYHPLLADGEGIAHSRAFPGLSLDVTALLRGEMAAVWAVSQQSLKIEEHGAFVKRLLQSGL